MDQGTYKINERLITGRPTLTIDEAIQMSKCTVADLFNKAEIGELVIFVIADGWKAGRIYEIDHSIDDISWPPKHKFHGPEITEMPSTGDEDFEGKYAQWSQLEDCRDQIFGNIIDYGRLTRFRVMYERSLTDRQPISTSTFREYRINPEKAVIELDLNQILKVTDKIHERFLRPEPEVLLQDSLANGKLVVMAAELKKLLGQNPDENLSELYEHEYWPQELGMAFSAWQHARDTFKPGQNPKEIMEKWLKGKILYGKSISAEAIERIATIANWQKKGGRTKVLEGE